MRLSPRLQLAADLCPMCGTVADVGSDHCFLCIQLVKAGKATQAVATDIHEGPVLRGREEVAAAGLKDRIDVRLCDGLCDVAPEECDVVAVLGMGGEMIASILENSPWAFEKTLVLQPMTRAEKLRDCLFTHDMAITREVPVIDRGRPYTVMLAKRGDMHRDGLSRCLGALRDEIDSAEKRAYLEKVLARQRQILEGLAHRGGDDEAQRLLVAALMKECSR